MESLPAPPTAIDEPVPAGRWVLWLGLALSFAISYTQAPLYYSNQNQYFLHGLAHAGHGYLADDWLVGTLDPAPLFSGFVALVANTLGELFFNPAYMILQGVYFLSLMAVSRSCLGAHGKQDRSIPTQAEAPALLNYREMIVAAVLMLLHAGIIRLISVRLFGVDYPWYLQAGVAGQYLLGFGLQPSVFGVLLLASIPFMLINRPWIAVTLAGTGAIAHATYLLPAALLIASYLTLLLREGRWRLAGLLGSCALALVMPTVIYNYHTFGPNSEEAFKEAQGILAHLRIPHHAEPERWFDGIAFAQVCWIALGTALAWRTRLFWIMAIVSGLSLALTAVQIAVKSDSLALLFPWRSSVLLVPLATAVVATRFVQTSNCEHLNKRCVLASEFVIVLCIVGGVFIFEFRWGYATSPGEIPLLEYVDAHKKRGDVYLLPVEIPEAPRGARSTNFTPPPRRGQGALIAIDLQRFRLDTGAPIYVDFKAIPYKDVEVLEWHRRLLWANNFYAHPPDDPTALMLELQREGITHVVVPTDRPLHSPALELIHQDAAYLLYKVVSVPSDALARMLVRPTDPG